MARLTDNRPFALPDPPAGGFPLVAVSDPALADDLTTALEGARAALDAAVGGQRGVRLASAEIFAMAGTRALGNSRDLRGAYEDSRVYADLVLVAGENCQAAEFHADLSRRRVRGSQFRCGCTRLCLLRARRCARDSALDLPRTRGAERRGAAGLFSPL